LAVSGRALNTVSPVSDIMKRKTKRNRRAHLTAFFQEMGEAVEREWRDVGYDSVSFPDIAAAALERFKSPGRIDPIDVLREIDAAPLARQQDVEGNFSNLPITLFSSTRFYIDLYFWLDGTTAIHQHGFAGAFQVLSGSSLHGHYQFRVTRPISPHFALGDLTLREVRLLEGGDIRQIVPGRDYIHSLFHLDRPSTTLTVRTISLPSAQPQFNYVHPGVAFDPFFVDPAIIKRVQTADVLLRMPHPDADAIIGRMLTNGDLHTVFALLNTAYEHLIHNEPSRLKEFSVNTNRWKALLSTARASHGDATDLFVASLAESQRQISVITRRSYATSPDLRFFLALLLNLQDRKQILGLVQQRYPEEPALETVLNWVEDLSRINTGGESNALGIDGFDDIYLLVIESLVKGKSLTQTQRELRKLFRQEDPELLNEKTRARYDELSHNALLTPLFAIQRT
jgi:hypothetical protein